MSVSTEQAALDMYEILEKLGEGTYGVVYKATQRNSSPLHTVALKKIKVDANDEGVPATTIREISLLNNLSKHPFIVKLEKTICIKKDIWLVFEFATNDLKKYLDSLRSNSLLDLRKLKVLSYMLMEGVRYCHAQRILHRDLKPQNILITQDGILKIADFGLGREHGLPIDKLTHEVVTLWYRPCEILMGQERYSGACDMWGVGCIMAEMATKRALFPGDCEIDQLFQIFQILGTPTEGIWPGVASLPDYKPSFPKWKPKNLDQHLKSRFDGSGIRLVKSLLAYAPNRRVTAKQALLSPWFDDVRDAVEDKLRGFKAQQQQVRGRADFGNRQHHSNCSYNGGASGKGKGNNGGKGKQQGKGARGDRRGNDNQENVHPNGNKPTPIETEQYQY